MSFSASLELFEANRALAPSRQYRAGQRKHREQKYLQSVRRNNQIINQLFYLVNIYIIYTHMVCYNLHLIIFTWKVYHHSIWRYHYYFYHRTSECKRNILFCLINWVTYNIVIITTRNASEHLSWWKIERYSWLESFVTPVKQLCGFNDIRNHQIFAIERNDKGIGRLMWALSPIDGRSFFFLWRHLE